MKKRNSNPKVRNAWLLVLCVVLILVLGSMLYLNHKQEAISNNELKKAAQEEIQKEKTDQTWTENQKTEDSQTSEEKTTDVGGTDTQQ